MSPKEFAQKYLWNESKRFYWLPFDPGKLLIQWDHRGVLEPDQPIVKQGQISPFIEGKIASLMKPMRSITQETMTESVNDILFRPEKQ